MTRNAKISLTMLGVFVVVLVVALLVNRPASPAPSAAGATSGAVQGPTAGAVPVVREDTHLLTTAEDGRVTLVEFLDFECESCLAMYPVMERIREEYEGRITFGVRYFPIPAHPNSGLAALTVEAAAQQGQFEAMYQKMYETQEQWSHTQASQQETFFGFARELGLDMERFEAALRDRATADRVARDQTDGIALGVQGTPTLFLNGETVPSMPTYEELTALIDAELAR